ncbi:MAG: ABC transporter permease subunit [Roseburia sp.]|nr:ABC transporter permease subunit [Roseburia sp.]
MSNLFRAGMQRLKKNRMFWLCMFAVAAYDVFACCSDYRAMRQYDVVYQLDDLLYLYVVPLGILIATVLGMFWGTEYSEGTIRNKIISGKSRGQIYLSGWLVSMLVAVFIYLMGLLGICVLGIPLFGLAKASILQLVCMEFVGILASMAYASIFYAIAMVCQSKAHTVLICELLAFLLMFAGIFLMQKLAAPAMVEQMELNATGELSIVYAENPGYLSGMKREVYEFIRDLLPSGQTMQLMEDIHGEVNVVRMMVLAVVDSIASSAAGMFLFCRRDIK